MTIRSTFPSSEAMEQMLEMGMEEGLSSAMADGRPARRRLTGPSSRQWSFRDSPARRRDPVHE